MTTVTGQPPKDTEANQQAKRRTRILAIAVVVLVLIAIVLAVVVWNDRSAGSAMPADVEQVIGDYTGAIAAQDVDAWQETITDDFTNKRNIYGFETHELWADLTLDEAEYEQTGEPLVTGDGPWFVTVAQSWLDVEFGKVFDGSATYAVVERDGVMKVASEYWVGTINSSEE